MEAQALPDTEPAPSFTIEDLILAWHVTESQGLTAEEIGEKMGRTRKWVLETLLSGGKLKYIGMGKRINRAGKTCWKPVYTVLAEAKNATT